MSPGFVASRIGPSPVTPGMSAGVVGAWQVWVYGSLETLGLLASAAPRAAAAPAARYLQA